MDGILVLDKPPGWTSHDVVAKVRRITGVRRVGHAGTLDPAATGVLPLGVGRATRVLEYLAGAGKSYRAVLRLGATTDTDDAEGAPLVRRDWHGITPAQVHAALAAFLGEITQIPPAYSAIKQAGVPLHRLARAGRAVSPPSRRVRIERIAVLEMALPEVTVEVDCSKGTYVRSLARDVGETLGCGAHLAALRRLQTGCFTLRDAHTLDQVQTAADTGALPALLLPPDAALRDAPVLVAGPDDEVRLLSGRAIGGRGRRRPAGTLARVYAADGTFLALAETDGAGWRPRKVFA